MSPQMRYVLVGPASRRPSPGYLARGVDVRRYVWRENVREINNGG
jgi:hypothetical protein